LLVVALEDITKAVVVVLGVCLQDSLEQLLALNYG
jgi:hypothetical protein